MTDCGITSVAKKFEDGATKFGGAIFYELAASPFQAAYQLADQSKTLAGGTHLPPLEISKPDSSGWSTAGSFVGTVAKYALLSKVVHGVMNTGETKAVQQTLAMTVRNASVESSIVGATAGFLTPVEPGQNYWQEKGVKTVVSAGSFGVMGGTSALLNKTSFMAEQKGSLTRAVAVNGIAGVFGGTSESILDASLHHRSLDYKQTAINAGSYGLFGAAFGGTAHIFSARLPVADVEPARVNSDNGTRTNYQASQLSNTQDLSYEGTRARASLTEHAQRALAKAQEHVARFGDFLDNSLSQLIPLNPMDGLQPAYARAGAYGNGRMPSRANVDWNPGTTYSVAYEGGRGGAVAHALETGSKSGTGARAVAETVAETVTGTGTGNAAVESTGIRKSGETRTTSDDVKRNSDSPKSPSTKGYSISSVLAKSERGSSMNDVLTTLNEEHPNFLKGLRAEHPQAMGGGRDSFMLKLVDGRYKNALLRFTTIFGQAQDTLTPTQWDPEWGKRPYDAPLLSKVIEVDNGGEDRVYVYVQENGEGAIDASASTFDLNEDASFARDASEPSFLQMMEELEQRGEEWVDPGSRQLVYSPLKGRLVLVDYPAVMRSADIPQEWRDRDSGLVTSRPQNAYGEHNDANESSAHDEETNPYSHEVLDLSREEKRYNFLNRTGSPQVAMQSEIAQQLFDGDSEKDMIPLVDFMFKDTLSSLKMTAREAIKSTREQLRKEGLL